MSRHTRILPRGTLRERPASAVAGVFGLALTAYVLLTPSNVLLPVPALGVLFGTAYFVDVAVGSPRRGEAPPEHVEGYSRAEHVLGVAIAAAVLLPVVSIPLASGVGLVATVAAGVVALALTVVCWCQRP